VLQHVMAKEAVVPQPSPSGENTAPNIASGDQAAGAVVAGTKPEANGKEGPESFSMTRWGCHEVVRLMLHYASY
jgi:hypothetical protein